MSLLYEYAIDMWNAPLLKAFGVIYTFIVLNWFRKKIMGLSWFGKSLEGDPK